jgi:signal transduction histidine kinase
LDADPGSVFNAVDRLSLRRAGTMLWLDVADCGAGLASTIAGDESGKLHGVGVGISGMRVRLKQLAGKLDIEPARLAPGSLHSFRSLV